MNLHSRLVAAVLNGVLAFFPARYRDEYGAERIAVFNLTLEDAAAHG
jgi:hypothetical protein